MTGRRRSHHGHFHLGLVLFGALVAIGHVAWIVHFRSGRGIGLDEARLLPVAHQFADALERGDVAGLARTWVDHEVTAPLLALITAPVLVVIDDPGVAGPIPVALFAGLLVVVTAEVALALADRTAAVVAAGATSVGLGFVLWARVHEQIVPGAALWVLSLFLLVRSDALRRPWWRWTAGLALGSALLARTMLVGFVPLLLGLYALHCWRRGRLSAGAWLQLIGITGGVAGTWWAFQWRSALEYLGPRGYEGGGFALGPARWAFEVAALMLVGAFPIWVATGVLARTAVHARRARALPDLGDPRVLLAAVAAATFVVLVTVGEEFPGFQLLVAPPLLAVAATIRRARDSRLTRVAFGVSLAVSAALAILPGASWFSVVDGSASDLVRGPPTDSPAVAVLPDTVVAAIADHLPPERAALLAIYGDQRFENVHVYEAAARAEFDGTLRSLDPSRPIPTDELPAAWPDVDLVVTYDIDGCTYQEIDVCLLDERLDAAGFVLIDHWHVHDDRAVRMWSAR